MNPGFFTPFAVSPPIFQSRIFHTPVVSPPDVTPPGLFPPKIFHTCGWFPPPDYSHPGRFPPRIVHPCGFFTPQDFSHLCYRCPLSGFFPLFGCELSEGGTCDRDKEFEGVNHSGCELQVLVEKKNSWLLPSSMEHSLLDQYNGYQFLFQ